MLDGEFVHLEARLFHFRRLAGDSFPRIVNETLHEFRLQVRAFLLVGHPHGIGEPRGFIAFGAPCNIRLRMNRQ